MSSNLKFSQGDVVQHKISKEQGIVAEIYTEEHQGGEKHFYWISSSIRESHQYTQTFFETAFEFALGSGGENVQK